MAVDISGVVTWLKGWFYEKSEVNTYLNAKANLNQGTANYNVVTNGTGNIDVEPKINVASGSGLSLDNSTKALSHSNTIDAQSTAVFKKIKYDGQGHITGTSTVQGSDLPGHSHNATGIVDANAINYTNISPTLQVGENQQVINSAINTAIGNLSSIRAIEVVSTLPTASSSTMGKLYIISENSKINVYYTEQSGSSYSWHKMDADILDELSIAWTDITGRPTKTSDFTNDGADGTNVFVANNDSRLSDARTPTSHTHGNLTNDGKVGSVSGKIITTGTDGAIQASDSITKSMISDFPSSMTPASHTHGQVTNDGKITSTAVTIASNDKIVITDTSDSNKVKRVENLLANQVKDSNGHTHIGSSVNDTQETINTKIDNALDELNQSLAERKVFYVDYSDLPSTDSDWGFEELYLTTHNGEWLLYYWREVTSPTHSWVLDYVTLSLSGHTHNNYVTSIALVPKSSDNTGAIRMYYGDEPSNS